MAIVRISKDLMTAVDRQVVAMSSRAAAAGFDKNKPADNPRVSDALVEHAKRKWYEAAPGLRDSIPDEWFTEISRIDFRVRIPGRTTSVYIEGEFFVPQCAGPSYNSVDVNVEEMNVPSEVWGIIVEYAEAKKAHEDRYKSVKEQVTRYLKGAASLNDAVKKFPNISLYLPKEYIDKINEKTVKKERGEEGISVDTTLLSTVGAKHLLGGE